MNCDCNDKCCELYNDIDDDDNQYLIDRLEDIIEICEFLIQVTKHQKMKKDTCDTILKDLKKESEKEKEKEKEYNTYTWNEKNNLPDSFYRELLEYMMKQKNHKYPPYTSPGPGRWEVWF